MISPLPPLLPQARRRLAVKFWHITPHTAGGHHNESERLVHHFLDNLARFSDGQPLLDRVV